MRASSSDRAIACPASLALPQAERQPNEARDKAAAFGTLCHYWKETGSTDMPGASEADKLCLDKKIIMSGISRNEWWPEGTGEHETTFALHLDTHVVKWFEGDKAEGDIWKSTYYDKPKWVTGTCDWSSEGPLLVYVDDLKSGRWPVSAVDNKQLLTYALPFWMKQGMPLAAVIKLSITQWEKYPLTGLPKRNWWQAAGLDMLMHLQDLKHAVENPEETNPDKETCRFCDARTNCPDFLAAGFDYTRR